MIKYYELKDLDLKTPDTVLTEVLDFCQYYSLKLTELQLKDLK